MAANARRLTIIRALAILLVLGLLGAPEGTPAQAPATDTPTDTPTAIPTSTAELPTNTAVPPSDTPAPTETATTSPTTTPVATVSATAEATEPSPPATSTAELPAPTATATLRATPTATPPPLVAANHTASITPTRATVNALVSFTLTNYPPNAPVTIFWKRNTGSTFQFATSSTDSAGSATGQFRVPAVTGGLHQTIVFVSGEKTKRAYIDIRPRIKVLTNPAVCGKQALVSLRGYAKNETVRIRWKVGASWIQLGTVVTSNTGSAHIMVTVPASAADGLNSVRGDGTVFRQQTNAAVVDCS
jgi:hypothetical protein